MNPNPSARYDDDQLGMTPRASDRPQVLTYATTTAARKPFSLIAFFEGLIVPYLYGVVASIPIGLITSRMSAAQASYGFVPSVIIALAAFPFVIWWMQRQMRSRGFVRGVIVGTIALPLLVIIGVAISFRHGH